jgi:hypothetical protein
MLKYALRDGGKIYLFRLILFVIELQFHEIFLGNRSRINEANKTLI